MIKNYIRQVTSARKYFPIYIFIKVILKLKEFAKKMNLYFYYIFKNLL